MTGTLRPGPRLRGSVCAQAPWARFSSATLPGMPVKIPEIYPLSDDDRAALEAAHAVLTELHKAKAPNSSVRTARDHLQVILAYDKAALIQQAVDEGLDFGRPFGGEQP